MNVVPPALVGLAGLALVLFLGWLVWRWAHPAYWYDDEDEDEGGEVVYCEYEEVWYEETYYEER
ncbi:hypothetical protein [Polymorphospora rubra]|uniref:Uncharacterized protein n=1 Tax=Polymorphospora rubra TaxID=338584 RepID=A0A810MVC3_9ACTN|nr:hypothetical protein [Polymorphospora rubra]BCJ65101.1 hypothetical protein Prubr_21220 [Polymorphospora rubra]